MKRCALIPIFWLAAHTAQGQLANADFETQGAAGIYSAANWTVYGAVNREPWANQNGGFGMALEWWNGDSGGFYQDVTGVAGVKYTLAAWCSDDSSSVTTGVYAMKLEYYDSARTLLASDVTNISALVNTTWNHLALVGQTCPANCATVRALFIGSKLVSGETLKIDAVTLTQSAGNPSLP